jgi:hypothetical protein
LRPLGAAPGVVLSTDTHLLNFCYAGNNQGPAVSKHSRDTP